MLSASHVRHRPTVPSPDLVPLALQGRWDLVMDFFPKIICEQNSYWIIYYFQVKKPVQNLNVDKYYVTDLFLHHMKNITFLRIVMGHLT